LLQEPYIAVEVCIVERRELQEIKQAKAKAKALVKCGSAVNQAPVKYRSVLNHTQLEALWNRDSLASSVTLGARDITKLVCLLAPGACDPSKREAKEAIAKVPGQEY
jgi:hypothetical protein